VHAPALNSERTGDELHYHYFGKAQVLGHVKSRR
jgi:hypothetical protein